ncbi:NAD(P)-binding protein [Zopfia rhizophila CBS 207.26]|uniref:NAD(P)-binding protein n=1 Tax=Zopfia rhizophila CBS 207.26 TaxID=1314779 RepID=A0A6A6E7N1_9PEZI|nr:NAD(P)-binding protein [Zopfia rhizophila CBS 207.26]
MGVSLSVVLHQFWPPAPKFTEKDVPDQEGKVYIVTGASAGVGKELVKLLYSLNAKSISSIISTFPRSRGRLHFLRIDLSDLDSVAQAADAFLRKEKRLDALWNNAGVMMPPEGSKTKQGYELQLGTNTLAAFLFTRLLTPRMARTPGNPRVLWVASSATELMSPKRGIDMNKLDGKGLSMTARYGASKGGMALLSQEYAKRYGEDGIISVAMNPGNLKTDLRRHLPWWLATTSGWIGYDPIKGAYTELYTGFSKDITLENSGCWVIPWGRIRPVRKDIRDGAVSEADGGTGLGEKFWQWCEAELAPYLKEEGHDRGQGPKNVQPGNNDLRYRSTE